MLLSEAAEARIHLVRFGQGRADSPHEAAIGNGQHSSASGPRHEWIDLHFREMDDIREADASREFRAEKCDFAESGASPIADSNCPPCSADVG